MKNCDCCYKDQKPPSVVYVYIIDEDSAQNAMEINFYFDTDGYFNSSPSEKDDLAIQNARYVNEIIPTISEGYLGLIFVPILSFYTSQHEVMKRRMRKFYNELDDKDKIIILGDEEYGDPSGTIPPYSYSFATPGSIDRDTDYSDRLIAAIEKLRGAVTEDETESEDDQEGENQEEELKPLDTIVLNVDSSGSHSLADVRDDLVVNLFNYYSQDIPFSEEVIQSFNQLVTDAQTAQNGTGTILSYYSSYFSSGLFNGIGTRFVLVNGSEYPYHTVQRDITQQAANRLNNNWKRSCEVICRQRWTTSGGSTQGNGEGLYILPFYGTEIGPLTAYNTPILWEDISPLENDPDLDVYKILLEKRSAAEDPEDFGLDLRANFPYSGTYAPSIAIDYSRVGIGIDPFAVFTESPFKESVYNVQGLWDGRMVGNCPCYWFYPVNQYIKITDQSNFRDGYPSGTPDEPI